MRAARLLLSQGTESVHMLALQARRSAEEYRLHEALASLVQAEALGGDVRESMDTLRRAIADMETHMEDSRVSSVETPNVRELPAASMLPEGVRVSPVGRTGQVGLFATLPAEEGDVLWAESPLAVLWTGGHAACRTCLRPLFDVEGRDVENLFTRDDLAALAEQLGLPATGTVAGHFCSDECARDAPRSAPMAPAGDPTSALVSLLSSEAAARCERYLWRQLYDDEAQPRTSAALWQAVRTNATEVTTRPLALLMERDSVSPTLDADVESLGSALYFVASFANHSCDAANVAPEFLDSVRSTPWVATRAISPGDELLLDYASQAALAADKRIRLFLSHSRKENAVEASGRSKLMRLGRGSSAGTGAPPSGAASLRDMDATLLALLDRGEHDEVERHLLSKGSVPPVAVALIRHLREQLRAAQAEAASLRAQRAPTTTAAAAAASVAADAAQAQRARDAMRAVHAELRDAKQALRTMALELEDARLAAEEAAANAARQVRAERERREELEQCLRTLLRQWELKQQQSLLVLGEDEDEEGDDAGTRAAHQ